MIAILVAVASLAAGAVVFSRGGTGPARRAVDAPLSPTAPREPKTEPRVSTVASGVLAKRPELRREFRHQYGLQPLAFSADGSTLAAPADIRVTMEPFSITVGVLLWDIQSGKLRGTLERQPRPNLPIGAPMDVAFSPDGAWLAVASVDGTVTLYAADPRKPTRIFNFSDPVEVRHSAEAVVFLPDTTTLAAANSAGVLKFWDIPSGRELRSMQTHQVLTSGSFAVSPDGRSLGTGCGVSAVFSTAEEADQAGGLPAPDGTNSRLFGELKLWDLATGKLRWKRQGGYEMFVYTVAFSPDGSLVASDGRELRLWDVATGELKVAFQVSTDKEKRHPYVFGSRSLAFSPDGGLLVAGGARVMDHGPDRSSQVGELQVWDIQTGQLVGRRTYTFKQPSVDVVAFSPDGRLLEGSAMGQTALVRVWRLE